MQLLFQPSSSESEYVNGNDSDSDYKPDYSSEEESNLNEVIQNILETTLKDVEGIP